MKKKKKLKSSDVKTFERGKKNQKIYWHCLKIIETKQNIYDYQIEKYKRRIGYLQENNP